MLPREFVYKLHQVWLWALKSPNKINGGGRDDMRLERSFAEMVFDGGMYIEQRVIGEELSWGIETETAIFWIVWGVWRGRGLVRSETNSATPPFA